MPRQQCYSRPHLLAGRHEGDPCVVPVPLGGRISGGRPHGDLLCPLVLPARPMRAEGDNELRLRRVCRALPCPATGDEDSSS
ncbi:hypothetical protein HZA43_04910 [Candidatus Peregrinibacteria bacterium]|nr:hypothetical protein [Candidatus Peregrinibacteria bacterium]